MKQITDFHTHILPQMDDGSRSVEESLEMLRQERNQGIRTVVATPHFYARQDDPERFLCRRENAWNALREAMSSQPELPEVELGAEVYYFSGISDCEALPALTFSNKRYILLEMPREPWTETMYREIAGIYEKHGITPVIAHVDRYIRPFRTYGIPKRLSGLPVLVQANAEFFLNRGTSRMALQMLKAGQIHLLGSDCHDLVSRGPNLGAALKRIENRLGPEAVMRVHDCGEMVFAPEKPE